MRPMARKDDRSHRKPGGKATALALGSAALLLAAAALTLWMILPRPSEAGGATIASYEEMDIDAIQDELDKQVRASMMTVAVSPVCTLQEDGTLSLRVVNDEDNTLAQSFTISQNDVVIFESGRVEPGEEVSSCTPEGIVEGSALITVQGLDRETGSPSGSPAAVEVSVRAA